MSDVIARVAVIQADRDAAAAAHEMLTGSHLDPPVIRNGNCDALWIVQAFARHRIAALQSAGIETLLETLTLLRADLAEDDAERHAQRIAVIDAALTMHRSRS
jgi:hypothetical protein